VVEKIQNLNGQLYNIGKRQQENYMTFNPPFQEDNKKTLTS
jgi:tRNA1(Val) A37 N6-methylase TrmN6